MLLKGIQLGWFQPYWKLWRTRWGAKKLSAVFVALLLHPHHPLQPHNNLIEKERLAKDSFLSLCANINHQTEVYGV